MSCTDKNTMVFVVLEGEITVILHTTQFNAKKGDSFYIPPKVSFSSFFQCCESGSGFTGSTCFWASWIRIH
jgi:hypothetical protein